MYPPSLPCTLHVVIFPVFSWNPAIPRAGLMLLCSSLPMFSWTTVIILSSPTATDPFGNGKSALTWSAVLDTVLMKCSLIQTEDANAAEGGE